MRKWFPRLCLLTLCGLLGCHPTMSVPTVGMGEEVSTTPVSLRLRFAVGQRAHYRLTREYTKQVRWEGVPEDRADSFRDATTSTTLHLGFAQAVSTVESNGNADLGITVTELAYRMQIANQVKVDFDSRRPADANDPLMALIGGRYNIVLSPDGQVTAVTGQETLGSRIGEDSVAGRIARQLFSESEIRRRHNLPALASGAPAETSVGGSWRLSTTEDFQEMGKQSFYKVYTLTGADKDRATITLGAEPSTRGVLQETGDTGAENPFSAMMDNQQSLTGQWVLDRVRGQVQAAREELEVVWRVAGVNRTTSDNTPVFTIMTALRRYQLERVDE